MAATGAQLPQVKTFIAILRHQDCRGVSILMRAVSTNGMVLGGTYARKQAVALRLLQNGEY
jgi:hypothetical protein